MSVENDLANYELVLPAPHFPAEIIKASIDNQRLVQAAMKSLRATGFEEVPENDLFNFSAVISNQRLDSYFTKMADSSLKNYAADAQTGVAFLSGHRHDQKPIGYSIGGVLEETGSPAEAYPRVTADFYTIRGMTINGDSTDDLIKSIQYGLLRDVSIGFKDGEGFRWTCSVCGDEAFSWDCWHIPGLKYETVKNPDAEPDEQIREEVLCFLWVEHARLSEVSGVFDGSTPDAMITKVQREVRAGRLKAETLRQIESQFRVTIPTRNLILPVEFSRSENNTMADENKKPVSGASDNSGEVAIRSAALALGLDGVSNSTSAEDCAEKMRAEILRLRPFEAAAAEGKALRESLIKDAIKEGVRSDSSFDEAAKRKMLEKLDVESIEGLRDSWKAIADKTAKPATKRTSKDDPDEKEPDKTDEPNADEPESGAGDGDDDDTDDVINEDEIGGV